MDAVGEGRHLRHYCSGHEEPGEESGVIQLQSCVCVGGVVVVVVGVSGIVFMCVRGDGGVRGDVSVPVCECACVVMCQ